MIQKSASKSKSVDFHRQFISGCPYEQAGGILGVDECQDDSDRASASEGI